MANRALRIAQALERQSMEAKPPDESQEVAEEPVQDDTSEPKQKAKPKGKGK